MPRTFSSSTAGLSLKRKFAIEPASLPFSISHTPSRVRPVSWSDWGFTERMYQKFVTSSPRSVEAMSDSIVSLPPSRMRPPGNGVGARSAFFAQNRSYHRFSSTPFLTHTTGPAARPASAPPPPKPPPPPPPPPPQGAPGRRGSVGSLFNVTEAGHTFRPTRTPPP